MSEQKVVKGILLEDETVALYDFEAVANVPAVIKEIPVAKVGQYLVVEEVDSDGKITKVKAVNGSSSATESLDAINLYVCSDGEYTAGGSPTIAEPDKETFYLVPQDNEGTHYASWVYNDGVWQFVEMLTVTLEETEGNKSGDDKPATTKPVFLISSCGDWDGSLYYYEEQDRKVTTQELVDMYLAGTGHILISVNPLQLEKIIGVDVSYYYHCPNAIINSNGYAYIRDATGDDLKAALAKYGL